VVDLLDEELDAAIRIAHLPNSSLTAIRIGSVRRVVCASPAYLARSKAVRAPEDLAHHAAIAFSHGALAEDWSFAKGARVETVRPASHLIVNSADVAIAAAVAGRGVTRALSYQIIPELRAGQLKVVLAEFEPPPLPVHIVHAEGRRASARVRAFIDFAAPALQAVLQNAPRSKTRS
jgi:DNA-binding transcriptional LysR family regulator